MPPADWPIDAALVRRLLAAQAPDYAGLPLRPFAGGWDNALFRLGDDLLVRLPRRAVALPGAAAEAAWLPRIAPTLPVAVPLPVRLGAPDAAFEHPWSIVRFLPGEPAALVPPGRRGAAADALARFLLALHRPAPADAPRNPWRSIPLTDQGTHERLTRRLDRLPPTAREALADRWTRWSAAPAWPGPPLWLHGDLHPLNLLLDPGGGLAGVLDWGDLCAGDPACDLAAPWLLFDAPGRARCQAALAASGTYDAAVADRARAWALHLALIFATECDDLPALRAVGLRTCALLAQEPPSLAARA